MTHHPVVLFAFNRPVHLSRTLAALAQNHGAQNTQLIIYCDGPKQGSDRQSIDDSRQVARTCIGFGDVKVIEREKNLGLSNSIITGVSEQLEKFEQIIVLEDDMVTSQFFLQYMNKALNFYQKDDRVISIHGYTYPVQTALPETFFLRGADCWGWATWRRGWSHFNPDGAYLLQQLTKYHLLSEFDLDGAFSFSKMLRDQIKGLNDSWAIRWHASAFLENKLTLYPGRSLVHNIGNDASGTHTLFSGQYDVSISSSPIGATQIAVEQSETARDIIKDYFYQTNKLEDNRKRMKHHYVQAKRMISTLFYLPFQR